LPPALAAIGVSSGRELDPFDEQEQDPRAIHRCIDAHGAEQIRRDRCQLPGSSFASPHTVQGEVGDPMLMAEGLHQRHVSYLFAPKIQETPGPAPVIVVGVIITDYLHLAPYRRQVSVGQSEHISFERPMPITREVPLLVAFGNQTRHALRALGDVIFELIPGHAIDDRDHRKPP
jgi:hypothetical protein